MDMAHGGANSTEYTRGWSGLERHAAGEPSDPGTGLRSSKCVYVCVLLCACGEERHAEREPSDPGTGLRASKCVYCCVRAVCVCSKCTFCAHAFMH